MPAETAVTKLYLKRTFDVPRERVFSAWTNPAEIRKWFSPGDMDTPEAQVDLRVGGKYRIVMRNAVKNLSHIAAGVYREIRPPERLVFTWWWEGDPNRTETLVTVEFRDRGNQTEVVLTHEFLPDETSRREHNEGWVGCLQKLEQYLQS